MKRLWGGFAVGCGVMVGFELTGTVGRYPSLGAGGLLVAAGLVYAVTLERLAAALVAVVALLAWSGPHPATMIVFLFWGSLALALFQGDDLRLALGWQAGLCYLFAGLNKLFPPFLSGRILEDIAPWVPHLRLVAAAVVVTEVALGVLVLLRREWVIPVLVVFHTPLVVIAARDLWHGAALALYAGMMVWTVVAACHSRTAPRLMTAPDGATRTAPT